MHLHLHNHNNVPNDQLPYFDIYARPEYGLSAELIDLGEWQCAATTDSSIAFSYIRRPIPGTSYYDIITPYGYGGLSHRVGVSAGDLLAFRGAFILEARDSGCVSEFMRLSPLEEHNVLLGTVDATFTRSTFGGMITDRDDYFAAVDGRHRTSVRKATKSGLKVHEESAETLLNSEGSFRKIYDATMRRLNAPDMLRLDTEYYSHLLKLPAGSIRVLVAAHEGEAVGAALFLMEANRLHYHLSGATALGRSLCATNLILHHAITSDSRRSLLLHLGGGLREGDSLEKFKRRATQHRYTMQYTQTRINAKVYDELAANAPATDYFPAYRAPRES